MDILLFQYRYWYVYFIGISIFKSTINDDKIINVMKQQVISGLDSLFCIEPCIKK